MSDKWNRTLQNEGLAFWRTSSAAGLSGQFKQFRNRRKELHALAQELTRIACEFGEAGYVASVTMDDYNILDETVRKTLKDPFYAAFQSGIKVLMDNADVLPADTFTLICDDSDEYSSECLNTYRRIRSAHPEVADRIAGICFHDDKVYPPLQAADLFAYCYRKRAEKLPKGIWIELLDAFQKNFSVQVPGEIRI